MSQAPRPTRPTRPPSPATTPPRAQGISARGRATRARLLNEAREVILSGDGVVEVARVAHRAGVSAGLLYRYFGSKDGLVAAVVNEFYDQYDAEVFTSHIDAGPGWAERERARIRREIDFLCDDPLGRVIVARRLREPAAAQADAERLARQVDIAARSIAKGQRDGELDTAVRPAYAAAAVLGAFRELMAEALSGEADPPREELLEVMLRTGGSLLLQSSVSDISSSR